MLPTIHSIPALLNVFQIPFANGSYRDSAGHRPCRSKWPVTIDIAISSVPMGGVVKLDDPITTAGCSRNHFASSKHTTVFNPNGGSVAM